MFLFFKKSRVYFFLVFILTSVLNVYAADFPLLKISKNEKAIWLVGSMHVGSFKSIDREIIALVTASNSICFEGDMNDVENAIRTANILNFNPDETTLKKRLGDQIFKRVTEHLPLLFSNGNMMPDASPFLIGNILTLKHLPIQKLHSNLQIQDSLDVAIKKNAISQGKKIIAIEDADAVSRSFERITDGEWQIYIHGLLRFLDCKECSDHFSENMNKAFELNHDYESSYGSLKKAFSIDQPAFRVYEKMYFGERNSDMARKIEIDAVDNGKCDLVVIGMSHLGGDGGIVNLLRKRGMKIQIENIKNF
jgi:uncharacterized protein YbaP (TraB family)